MRKFTLFLSLFSIGYAQYPQYNQRYINQQPQQLTQELVTKPPPRILSHQQAQSHDGAFKFTFASENGLKAGEIIAPDGTRNGEYSYVDPHGKEITVKYVAGKDGFRIIQGDHIPRSSVPLPAPAAHKDNGYDDDGQYRPELHEKPYEEENQQSNSYNQRPYQQQSYNTEGYRPVQQSISQQQPIQPSFNLGAYRQVHQTISQQQSAQPSFNIGAYRQVQQAIPQQQKVFSAPQTKYNNEPEYNDDPGKANSFGVGYSFAFAG